MKNSIWIFQNQFEFSCTGKCVKGKMNFRMTQNVESKNNIIVLYYYSYKCEIKKLYILQLLTLLMTFWCNIDSNEKLSYYFNNGLWHLSLNKMLVRRILLFSHLK